MSTKGSKGNRVLVIGLDGATFRVLDPLIEAGVLPNLERLMIEGARGTLWSTVPPISAAAWTTFITGKNPGKHGIFHFVSLGLAATPEVSDDVVEVGVGAYAVVNANSIRDATLWQMVSEAGKRLVVINVPMTYPPRPINGVMITSMLTPPGAEQYTYPPELKDQLEDYQIELDLLRRRTTLSKAQIIHALAESVSMRGRVALRLMRQEPWDLFTIVFTETDRLQHRFWNYLCPTAEGYDGPEAREHRPALHRFFSDLDDWVGRLVEEAGPEVSVVIMSDHGFTARGRKRVYVRALAHELGLFSLGKASWVSRLRAISESVLGLRYTQVYSVLKRVLPREFVTRVFHSLRGRDRRGFDSQKGRVIKFQQAVGAVSLNRRPLDARAQSELERIRGRLETLRDPVDGCKVVRKVAAVDEIYWGPLTKTLPPLMFFLEDGYGLTSGTGRRGRVIEHQQTAPDLLGMHAPDGILVLRGPAIVRRELAGEFFIWDVTATVLYLLGMPIPRDLDGRVVSEALDPDFLAVHPIRRSEGMHEDGTGGGPRGYSREEAEAVEARLRGLGYID